MIINTQDGLRGICWDDTTGSFPWNCLTTDEVRVALFQARAQTGKKINMDAVLPRCLRWPRSGRMKPVFLRVQRKLYQLIVPFLLSFMV